MPYIIADKDGNICKTRKKIYPSKRGAAMGYNAELVRFLQHKFLYDNSLDYLEYLDATLGRDNPLDKCLTKVSTQFTLDKIAEFTEEFKALYHIKEVTVV